jgi:hypothetical protein
MGERRVAGERYGIVAGGRLVEVPLEALQCKALCKGRWIQLRLCHAVDAATLRRKRRGGERDLSRRALRKIRVPGGQAAASTEAAAGALLGRLALLEVAEALTQREEGKVGVHLEQQPTHSRRLPAAAPCHPAASGRSDRSGSGVGCVTALAAYTAALAVAPPNEQVAHLLAAQQAWWHVRSPRALEGRGVPAVKGREQPRRQSLRPLACGTARRGGEEGTGRVEAHAAPLAAEALQSVLVIHAT